ncbi:zinc transport system ATP-binding protein [Desulfonispora thiosulfatigenes DSM 11270]|uniref:Zinc transport system ATP-binding protein n=1 Tax=Desulfonispora thiosulfatigenes DSM 11270 TaxID=656914 RepID=A0A1W1VUI8_DESTI|nr:metal ABC transporter ATP-binding protein [Desulfonispora thiosulfatigenes]SMB96554.1 zinc transport system ATP-binding protein [Desulfonispora thiosulfatigenes DSM 11270]
MIYIKNLNVQYGSITALSDINLKVSKNDFLGIIGPNGGGKSTLLKTILSLIPPSSGTIRILGQNPKRARKYLGFVPQFSKFKIDFPINVNDVVSIGCLAKPINIFHRYTSEDKEKISSILEKLDLKHLKERQIGELSGGQLQKVLIARALASDPEILLLDEPTASLDSRARNDIYSLLKELNHNMTIIMVTHDMSILTSHVKSIACLNQTLHYHGEVNLTDEIMQKTFGCPVDLFTKRISKI